MAKRFDFINKLKKLVCIDFKIKIKSTHNSLISILTRNKY